MHCQLVDEKKMVLEKNTNRGTWKEKLMLQCSKTSMLRYT